MPESILCILVYNIVCGIIGGVLPKISIDHLNRRPTLAGAQSIGQFAQKLET